MLRQFLTGGDVGQIAHVRPAVLFREGNPHHSHLTQRVPSFLRKPLIFIHLGRLRGHLLNAEVLEHVQDVLFFLGKVEIHNSSLLDFRPPSQAAVV